VLNERHLTRLRQAYVGYYHGYRTHRVLGMDTPVARPVQLPKFGRVREVPEAGDLHYHYERMAEWAVVFEVLCFQLLWNVGTKTCGPGA
jgi:hypothetical protein